MESLPKSSGIQLQSTCIFKISESSPQIIEIQDSCQHVNWKITFIFNIYIEVVLTSGFLGVWLCLYFIWAHKWKSEHFINRFYITIMICHVHAQYLVLERPQNACSLQLQDTGTISYSCNKIKGGILSIYVESPVI